MMATRHWSMKTGSLRRPGHGAGFSSRCEALAAVGRRPTRTGARFRANRLGWRCGLPRPWFARRF